MLAAERTGLWVDCPDYTLRAVDGAGFSAAPDVGATRLAAGTVHEAALLAAVDRRGDMPPARGLVDVGGEAGVFVERAEAAHALDDVPHGGTLPERNVFDHAPPIRPLENRHTASCPPELYAGVAAHKSARFLSSRSDIK